MIQNQAQRWHPKAIQSQALDIIYQHRDLLAVLPTGTGKSYIYQQAGISLPHLTLVITPLLALMSDQVQELHKQGIMAASWNSITPRSWQQKIIRELLNEKLKFLYLSPEKLLSPVTSALLCYLPICQIAIDEAHCVSAWSGDFRPQYGKIGKFINRYSQHWPRPIISAFTATATSKTISEITSLLRLKDPGIVTQPCFRVNLQYEIVPVPAESWKRNLILRTLDLPQVKSGTTIIYAATRLDVLWLAHWLSSHGYPKTLIFHAGLSQQAKADVLQALTRNAHSLLVTTNAFGLGVDYPQINTIIHHSPPASIEAYVQEAGRAGRTGQPAYSIVFFQENEFLENLEFILETTNPQQYRKRKQQAHDMWQLLHRRECIQRQIVRYFRLPQTQPCSLDGCRCQFCQPHLCLYSHLCKNISTSTTEGSGKPG
jgi:ATP-dependent DNA helicase RecQ